MTLKLQLTKMESKSVFKIGKIGQIGKSKLFPFPIPKVWNRLGHFSFSIPNVKKSFLLMPALCAGWALYFGVSFVFLKINRDNKPVAIRSQRVDIFVLLKG